VSKCFFLVRAYPGCPG